MIGFVTALEIYGLIREDGFRRLVRTCYAQVPADDVRGRMYPRNDLPGGGERLREFR